MSTYSRLTKHPKTGQWENATWYDDLLGHHHYGVVFPSDLAVNANWEDIKSVAFDPEKINLETKHV